jgi:hypothetical protein
MYRSRNRNKGLSIGTVVVAGIYRIQRLNRHHQAKEAKDCYMMQLMFERVTSYLIAACNSGFHRRCVTGARTLEHAK